MCIVKKLDNLPVTKNVVKIINEDGLDKKTIAQRIGVSEQGFDDMLNGDRIITAFDVVKLYTALGVDANALFKKEGGLCGRT